MFNRKRSLDDHDISYSNKYLRSNNDNENDDDSSIEEPMMNNHYLGGTLRLSSIDESNTAQVVFDNDALLNILPSNINTDGFQNDDDLDMSNNSSIDPSINNQIDIDEEQYNKQYILDKYRSEMAFKIEKARIKYEMDVKYDKERAERESTINQLQIQKDQIILQYIKFHFECRYNLLASTQYIITRIGEVMKNK